jgi:hypothetical protein
VENGDSPGEKEEVSVDGPSLIPPFPSIPVSVPITRDFPR